MNRPAGPRLLFTLLAILLSLGIALSLWNGGGASGGLTRVDNDATESLPLPADAAASTSEDSQSQLTTDEDERIAVSSTGVGPHTITVFDLSGVPVSGLRLGALTSWPWMPMQFETTRQTVSPLGATDAEGQLLIPRGVLDVDASAMGLSLVCQSPEWLLVSNSEHQLPLANDIELQVRKGGGVRGVVVGPNGPVADAVVGAMVDPSFFDKAEGTGPAPPHFSKANERITRTDANGAFELAGLLPQTEALHVLADGLAPLRHEFDGPQPGETTDVGFLELEYGLLTTFLLTCEGAPLPQAVLALEAGQMVPHGASGAVADDEGKIALAGMLPGEYKWSVARGDAIRTHGKLVIPANTDGSRSEVVLDIPPLRALSIRVVTAFGTPLGPFRIKAKPQGGSTQELRGTDSIELQWDGQGLIKVRADADGYATSNRASFSELDTEVTFVLLKRGSLELALRGAGEASTANAKVVHEEYEQNLATVRMGLPTYGLTAHPLDAGDDGRKRLVLAQLKAGDNWVVLDLGGGPEVLGPFHIRPGATTTAEVEVETPLSILGVVRDATTQLPIEGVEITRSGDAGSASAVASLMSNFIRIESDAVTDAAGGFQLLVQPRPKVSILLRHPLYEDFVHKFTGDLRDLQPLSLDMEPSKTAALEVHLVEGTPAAGAVLHFGKRSASGMPNMLTPTRLDSHGKGQIAGLYSGEHILSVETGAVEDVMYRFHLGKVSVGEDAAIRLVLMPETGAIFFPAQSCSSVREISITQKSDTARLSLQENSVKLSWPGLTSAAKSISVPPGKYLLNSRDETGRLFAACEVAPGENTTVTWKPKDAELDIKILGGNWRRADFELQPKIDSNQFFSIKHGEGSSRVDDLPHGEAVLSLLSITDSDGRKTELNWAKQVTLGAAIPQVTYNLNELKTCRVKVIDTSGASLSGALVYSISSGLEGTQLRQTGTDTNGVASMMLPTGAHWLAAVPSEQSGLAASIAQVFVEQNTQATLICEAGASLQVSVSAPSSKSNHPASPWKFLLLPEPLPADESEAKLAMVALQLATAPLWRMQPGESVDLSNLPLGTYVLIATRQGSTTVRKRVALSANGESKVVLALP